MGNYTDKMGKETRHQVPTLPITVVQGLGGYHANAINVVNKLNKYKFISIYLNFPECKSEYIQKKKKFIVD